MPSLGGRERTVLVTDAGRGSAIACIRAFGYRGWRVIAADSDPHSPGFSSRFAWDHLLYPSPTENVDEFVETLMTAVRKNDVELIIPVTDEAILPLLWQRTRFESVCQLAMAETPSLKTTQDKCLTVRLAERVGVPVPPTRLVHTAGEACEMAKELNWPIVLKPVVSRKYIPEEGIIKKYSVAYANDLEGLVAYMSQLEGQCPVLLQSYYQGSGQGVEMLTWRGRPIATFQHRRLCETPPSGGASALRESVPPNPQLFDYATRLTEALDWSGLIMLEFKVGEDGAQLMEINGRIWGSLPLAVASGVDFPALLAEIYQGRLSDRLPQPVRNYRVGVRATNSNLMLMWFGQVMLGKRDYQFLPFPSRRKGARMLLEMFNPQMKFDIFSLDDPRPGLVEVSRLGRKVAQKLRSMS